MSSSIPRDANIIRSQLLSILEHLPQNEIKDHVWYLYDVLVDPSKRHEKLDAQRNAELLSSTESKPPQATELSLLIMSLIDVSRLISCAKTAELKDGFSVSVSWPSAPMEISEPTNGAQTIIRSMTRLSLTIDSEGVDLSRAPQHAQD